VKKGGSVWRTVMSVQCIVQNKYMHQMKSLDLNLLAALDALLSTGSVSAAAERMHLSPPAMSHALARIREVLGDPVLVRAGRQLVPTPRAVEMREPVRRLVAEARELLQPGGEAPWAEAEREFVLRAPEGVGIVYGAALLALLHKTLPRATLRFLPESEGDAMALREGRIDLDIGTLPDRGPEIRSSLLYEQHLVGVVRTGHALLGARVTLKRFVGEAHVAITGRARAPDPLDRLLAEAGVARRTVLSVPSAYGAMIAAAGSDMVACVPEHLAATTGAALGLQVFKLPLALPPEQVVQAWHPRLDADAAHRCLRECVAAVPANAERGPLGRRRAQLSAAHRALAS
jgi:DNA-binding transcriptional LysR family regulator